jgi:hypothetical protein
VFWIDAYIKNVNLGPVKQYLILVYADLDTKHSNEPPGGVFGGGADGPRPERSSGSFLCTSGRSVVTQRVVFSVKNPRHAPE